MATATHGRTVHLIRSSGDAICLKVVTPAPRRAADRPRQTERVGVSCQQEARLSTASNFGSSKQRAQRTVNNTSTRVTPSQIAVGHPPSGHRPSQLTTARSMPDLTATVDHKHSSPDHTRRRHQNNDDATAMANDELQTSSVADYRNRVLYELTNRLRPSPTVWQPPAISGSSSAQRTYSESTASEIRLSADDSPSPQRRPAPPPRGTWLSSRPQASASGVSSSTASTAKTTGSELKELLVVSGHTATAGHVQQQILNSSPPTEARSTVSGEHLVLPSQLKKLQRTSTSIQTAKQSKGDGSETRVHLPSSHDGDAKFNGHSSVMAHRQAVTEHRLPAPKRPAPPPPSTSTTPPPTKGEINFLVMAEEARKQYIMSKLAVGTIAVCKTADNSSVQPTNGKQTADAKRLNDREFQKGVNGSLNYVVTTSGGNHFMANGKPSTKHLHTPTSSELCIRTASSSQADGKGLLAGQTVEQTVNDSPPLESLLRSIQQPSESIETSPAGPPPVIPPKRRPRNSSQVALCNSETSNFERSTMSNVDDNGTERVLKLHVSTNGFSGVNITQENLHEKDSNEHDRKSNAKLTRGKNVVIRRSGFSRLSPDDSMAVNGDWPSTSGYRSYDDAEQIQQLTTVCDVGILPPPPDFAD